MVVVIILGIILFDLVIFKISSRCSRIEEQMYIQEGFTENQDN